MYDNYLNQPAAPMVAMNAGASRQQEAMARERGFRSYEEMLLWAKQRNMQSGGTIAGAGAAGAPAKVPGSWREAQAAAKAAHPMSIFEYITNAMAGK